MLDKDLINVVITESPSSSTTSLSVQELDPEWAQVLHDLIASGVSKEQFRVFLQERALHKMQQS
jgi:non-ribosomal peptide synthetase component F